MGVCGYFQDFLPARDLKEGQEVMFLAMRGNYNGCTNKYHGFIEIKGTIEILETGERRVIPDKLDVENGKDQWVKNKTSNLFHISSVIMKR